MKLKQKEVFLSRWYKDEPLQFLVSVPDWLFSVWFLTRFQLEASPWTSFCLFVCVFVFGPILDSGVHFFFSFQLVLTSKEENQETYLV